MTLLRPLLSLFLTFTPLAALAGAPALDGTLPPLSIDSRGEITLNGDDFDYTPWHSDALAGKVQVIQYFGATMGDSKKFKPFTDRLGTVIGDADVPVITIVNLDAALWGTSGFVKSELQKNKKSHPKAIIVLDEQGTGVETWRLGSTGSALMILDDQGRIRLLKQDALSEDETKDALEILKQTLGG